MMAYIENIIMALGLVAVGIAGYYLFVIEGNRMATGGSEADRQSQELLQKFDEIREIDLATNIFSDPRFTSLHDFGVPVTPVSVGRENPFESAQ